MKVFVTGASGYIGEAVALELRRRGHTVYGLVRSAEKAKYLFLNEVHPVIGDTTKPETWKEIASKCTVLIQAALDWTNIEASDSIPTETFLEIGKDQPGTKLVVYTSGVLIYPDDPVHVKTEEDPIDPNFFSKGRADREVKVTKDANVSGVVIRPAFVYGQKKTLFEKYFQQASQGKLVVIGKKETVHPKIHIDDLVDAYVRIVEAPLNVVKGEIFNVGDDDRATDNAIAIRFGELVGYKGEVTNDTSGTDPLSFLWAKSVLVSSRKLTQLLGWTPRHLPILDEAELLYEAYKAKNNIKA